MKIKIKKLHPNAIIPTYANHGDAGLDLTAVSAIYNTEFDFCEYDTGLSVEIPEGYVGLIFNRSSISKKGQALCNAVGVIDSPYRGSIKLRFYTKSNSMAYDVYNVGDKIGQLMIIPYPKVELEEVTELSSTERGEGGFGSSGK